jgi:L-aspartate oxidase
MIYHDWDELRKLMSDYVGIVRRDLRLVRAKRRLQVLKTEIQEFYSLNYITSDFVELRNLVQVAELIIESASRRKNSVGLHYNMDHPNLPKTLKNTVLTPRKGKHHVLRPTH